MSMGRSGAQTARETELTLSGQLVGVSGLRSAGAHASYALALPSKWAVLSGGMESASHVDTPADGSGRFVFQQPISLVASGPRAEGWPTVRITVRSVDRHGRSDVAGYGLVWVPSASGSHTLSVPLWAPQDGSMMEGVSTFFIGGAPQLRDPELIFGVLSRNQYAAGDGAPPADVENADGEGAAGRMRVAREGLQTKPNGMAHVILNVCLRAK